MANDGVFGIIGGLGAVLLLGAWFLLFRNAYSSITESERQRPGGGRDYVEPEPGHCRSRLVVWFAGG